MSAVCLLGDSIIDNKVYVGEGELSVTEHLQHNSPSYFTMIAVDGDTTEDVLENQLDNLKEPINTREYRWVLNYRVNKLKLFSKRYQRLSESIYSFRKFWCLLGVF